MIKAVFLDRDGVINRRPPEGDYVTRWEDMQVLPGVPEAIALLTRAGYRVLGISNQRCGSSRSRCSKLQASPLTSTNSPTSAKGRSRARSCSREINSLARVTLLVFARGV